MKIMTTPPSANGLKQIFTSRLAEKGLSRTRTGEYDRVITEFYEYLTPKNIINLNKTSKALIIKYQYYLYNVKIYTDNVIKRKIAALNIYYMYLYCNGHIYHNPFDKIRLIAPPEEQNIRKIKRYYNFEELLKKWQTNLKKSRYAYETIQTKLHGIKIFYEYLQAKQIPSVYKADTGCIDGYLNLYLPHDKKYSSYNCYTTAMYLLQFYRFLKRALLINKYPTDGIDINEYKKEIERRTKDEGRETMEEQSPINSSQSDWQNLITNFSKYFMSLGRSKNTLQLYIHSLKVFKTFMDDTGRQIITKLIRSDIIEYQVYLASLKTKKDKPYSQSLIHNRIIALRTFFRYLLNAGVINCDPTGGIQIPQKGEGLSHNGLSEKEAEKLLNSPDTDTEIGIRDKAIMETLYSTGMRNGELTHLKTEDIDFTNGLIRINNPKGGRKYQRIVPIGRIACDYAKKYILLIRNKYSKEEDSLLFLSNKGNRLYRNEINSIIKKYIYRLGIKKRITTHSWRVTCATHMLLHNADIRYVQEQLGHRSIKTTQIYTRLVPKDLKRIHSLCHPREQFARATE